MTQAALIVAVHLVGVAVALAIGPRGRIDLCAAIGLPIGLILYVVCALAVMAAGLDYTPLAMTGCAVALIVASTIAIWRRGGLDLAAVARLGLWTLALAAVAVAASLINLTVLSSDSHTLIVYGRVIALDGSLDGVIDRIFAWGVFEVVAQSAVIFTRDDWMNGLHVALGAWFAPLFWVCMGDGIEAVTGARPRPRTLALITVALFSVFLFHHQVLYLHTNFGSAVTLFGFAILVWLAEVRNEPGLLPLAFICLIGFALMRTEAPAVAAVFALISLIPSRLPRRTISLWLAVFVAVIAGWYFVLSRSAPTEGQYLTASRCMLMIGGLAGVYALWLASALPGLRRLRPHAPEIAAGVLFAALATTFVLAPGHMLASARALLANIAVQPWWGFVWWVIAAIAILARGIEAVPSGKLFTWGSVIFFTSVLLLAFGRDPYRYGLGDSGNRMLIHILPILFYWFGLKRALARK